MAEERTIVEARIWVRRNFTADGNLLPKGEEVGEDCTIEVGTFPAGVEPSKVFRSNGLTVNLGKFESARAEVGISVPCYLEENDAADLFAQKKIRERLQGERKKVNDFLAARTAKNLPSAPAKEEEPPF